MVVRETEDPFGGAESRFKEHFKIESCEKGLADEVIRRCSATIPLRSNDFVLCAG